MATYDWTGLGLADNTVLDNSNTNAVGNGTGTLVYQALSGTSPVRVTQQSADGNGVTISGGTTALCRLDTSAITGGTECLSIDFLYKAPAAPTTDHNYLAVGRSAVGSTSHVRHNQSGTIDFCNSANAVVSSGATPALVAGDIYQVSCSVIRNTLTTPSTTNGRILGRVRSVTAPGTWNSGAEFFIDTGYAVNVTVDKTTLFRTGKAATAGAVASFDFLNLRWRDLATPETSTVKADAITNFVQDAAPTINTLGTGDGYPIVAVGTPVAGGALTYTITQTAGTTHTPVTTAAPGVWTVTQDTSASCTYDIEVEEDGGGIAPLTVVVPATTTSALGGQFRRRKRVSGAWV